MLNDEIEKQKLKQLSNQLNRIMKDLKSSLVFVEGQKDKAALAILGIKNVFTISGNLKLSCKAVSERGADRVIVLTDLDDRGDELAKEADGELTRYGIICDAETRKNIKRILSIRYIENMAKKYAEFMEKIMI